jgi:hypothetical protein
MSAADLYLTTYRLNQQGAFRAAVEPFEAGALRGMLQDPPVLITVGTGRHSAPARLLKRMQGAMPKAHLVHLSGPQNWTLLTVDARTCQIRRRDFSSAEKVLLDFTDELLKRVEGPAAILPGPMLEPFEDLVREQLAAERGDKLARVTDEPAILDGPEVRNRARLLEARGELLKRVPTVTSEELAALRGSITTNASQLGQDLRKAGKLFGVRHGKAWHYPRFQLNPQGEPYPEVAAVLSTFGAQAHPWDVLQWFQEPSEFLDGRSPLKAWPKHKEAVVAAARLAHWSERD